MKKKILIIVLMLVLGWCMGLLYETAYTIKEENTFECNRIPKYEFYDYEEAVLKEGNIDKFRKILCECGVDRFPYIIVMYDVYNNNVCHDLESFYSLIQDKCHRRNLAATAPLREFVKSVLTEYAERGDEDGKRKLQQFLKDEKSE